LLIWSAKRLHDQQYPFAQDGKATHHHRWSQFCRWHPPHQLASRRQWALLYEVQVSIMVNIISIFKTFDYVASYISLDFMICAWTLCLFPCFPWWLTLFPSKWFSLGMGFLLRTPLMNHCTIPDHTYHFPSLFPFISLSLGILGCINPRRGCPSFYGKKGLKAQRG
jgi:hypothetical protein